MIKVVLQYTDCLNDKKIVNYYLSQYSVKIIKTKMGISIYPKVTFLIDSMEKLHELICILNNETSYGASIVKSRNTINLLGFEF